MKKLFLVALGTFLISTSCALAATPDNFYNDLKNVNSDPSYVPGDYSLPETFASRTIYQTKKDELVNSDSLVSSERLFTINAGEVTFTALKNEKAEILGYFRNYFGSVNLKNGLPTHMDMLIDINSLDTSVPGRNNRILDLFFQSAKPEFGTAVISFDQFDLGGKTLDVLGDGSEHPVKASGHMTLNSVDRPLEAQLIVQKKGFTWSVKTAAPIELLITDFGLQNRVPGLLKACNHKALGNRVKVKVQLYFR